MKTERIVAIALMSMTPGFVGTASAQVASGMHAAPLCVARQLSLSVDSKDGQFGGMQKSGTELSIRNNGADCVLPALPRIEFLDARGHTLPVSRAVPIGMHPGPVMIPVHLGGGHRAATDLNWISGPVYAQNRKLRASYVRVHFGTAALRARLTAVIDTQPGTPGTFNQPPLRAMEGMAAG